MKKTYLSAPLPFVGQKRMFARKFMKVLEQYPESTVFVDLFGGSGLLSHITKRCKPEATVIYNDFDNYHKRLENIPRTNRLIADLRAMVGNSVPRHKTITGELRERIFSRILQEEHETGYVDFITLSSSLMFSMKYKLNVPEMRKEALYNNIRKADYPECTDYLEGLEIVSAITRSCQPVQRHAGRGVPGGPAVPFHRRGYLQYELAYVGLPRRAERAIRASVRLFHLKQILHPGAVRMDREKTKTSATRSRDVPDGVQRPHKLQLILHGHDAVQKRGCLTAFLCPLLK